jgi:predicted DCC family thiol-disulfide oxidoreductase YuxK
LIQQVGLSREQVDRDVWAIASNETRWRGADAVNRTLQELGRGWAWVASLYHLPPIRWIEDRIYRWVADHRAGLSGCFGVPPEWKE